MSTSLKIKANTTIAKPFKWFGKDRDYDPSQMATSHLFNTISMIWNHSMPSEYQTHNYIRYSFGVRHTQSYMMRAVRVMLPILLEREDLSAFQKARLDYMRNCLLRNPNLGYEEGQEHEPCRLQLS